jgi:hypothetical protein
VTANSFYPSNPTEADAYVNQAFSFQLNTATTLTFSATYSQTPHTALTTSEVICTSDPDADCVQDLHTSAATSPVYFDSTPDQGICNKTTLTPFPCSATLPAGTYELILLINDATFVAAAAGYVVHPYSDTLTVTIDGIEAPEPSPIATSMLGLSIVALIGHRRSATRCS